MTIAYTNTFSGVYSVNQEEYEELKKKLLEAPITKRRSLKSRKPKDPIRKPDAEERKQIRKMISDAKGFKFED